ncbi:metal-dependent hydrolase [Halosimplex pelagicum]|uniref:Metal-dependent hydrolase n=1 Tax=Halosimplex pelagicum TaxID=869886 RepID=A0A7D5P796_9EURY|nr:metal-dependent hydrolase [Halosimplex pelagicum]QLH80941.1 metal-dependent hydrolase [Halosimplex pelagicum]
MGSFRAHLRAGVGAHLALVSGAVLLTVPHGPVEAVVAAVVGAPVTVAGAVVPDVDHPNSRPYRVARVWVPRLTAGAVGFAAAASRESVVGLFRRGPVPDPAPFWAGVAVTAATAAVFVATVRAVPLVRPTHRGITHHPAFGVALSLALTALTLTLLRAAGAARLRLVSLVAGLCFLCGFASHLFVDDIWRVPSR